MEGFIIFFGAIFAFGTHPVVGVIYLAIVAGYKIKKHVAVDHYPLSQVDANRLAADNCSQSEKQDRLLKGYYNKKNEN